MHIDNGCIFVSVYICKTLAFVWVHMVMVFLWSLTGPKWDGDPLTPPLNRLGPPALWSVIHHPLGLSHPTLYPVATATLTAMAPSTGVGMDTETVKTVGTPSTITGLPVRASYTDISTMHCYQQVRTKNYIYYSEYHKTCICTHFSCMLNISTLPSHVKTNTKLWLNSQRLRYIHAHPVVSSQNGTLATRKKNWQNPKLLFSSPTAHPPHTLCGLHRTEHTDVWYQSRMQCVSMCTAIPLTHILLNFSTVCMCYCGLALLLAIMSLRIFTVILLTWWGLNPDASTHNKWNIILSLPICILLCTYNALSRLLFFF